MGNYLILAAPWLIILLSGWLLYYLVRHEAGCGITTIAALGGVLASTLAVVNTDWVMQIVFIQVTEGQRELGIYLYRLVPLFGILGSWLFAWASVSLRKRRRNRQP